MPLTRSAACDAELPDLDEVLAANPRRQHEINAALVKRYASKRIAARVLSKMGDGIGRMPCAERIDLAYSCASTGLRRGARQRAMTSREQAAGRSSGSGHADDADVEARVIADLDDPDPESSSQLSDAGASRIGGGAPAAARAFQRWHDVEQPRAELAYARRGTAEREAGDGRGRLSAGDPGPAG